MAYGAPDYTLQERPQRTVLGTGQSLFVSYIEVAVPALSTSTATIYTVPAGELLYVGSVTASCTVSGINEISLLQDADEYWLSGFDVALSKDFSPTATWPISAGYSLRRRFYNYDAVIRDMISVVMGFIEEV